MSAQPGPGPVDPARRRLLGRRARILALASVAYNVVEAIVAIGAGVVAGSVALVGFGLDSTVEVASGLIIVWQFSHRVPESRERQALRMLAVSFLGLAGYVAVQSVRALLGAGDPDPSRVGIGLAVASLLVMPALSWAQRRTGRQLGSRSVTADGTQTLLCSYLSAALLVGLLLNALLGWAWADPVAALVIAGVAAREGLQAWRGDSCCGPLPATATTASEGEPHASGCACTESDGAESEGAESEGAESDCAADPGVVGTTAIAALRERA